MKAEQINKISNKVKVTKLINQGLFDSHIDELSKALYTNRLFTKDIKCYFNEISNKKPEFYQSPKTSNHRKIFENKPKKIFTKTKTILSSPNHKKSGDVNSYELIKYKEDDINKEIQTLLKLLNDSQEETLKKFKELRKENDFFNSLYKICKSLIDKTNQNKDDNNIFLFLYDLLLKYKSNKNLTFDMDSLFEDVLKESPLSLKDQEKLKFHYIIHSERFAQLNNKNPNIKIKKEKKINPLLSMQNYNNEKNYFKKLEVPKQPKVIDMSKIKYLKEIKFLNKVNKRAKYKIITGGSMIGANNRTSQNKLKDMKLSLDENEENKKNEKSNEMEENEDEEDDDEKFDFKNLDKYENEEDNENKIINKKDLKLEIEKDLNDIENLKQTILESFREDKKPTFILKKSNSDLEYPINYLRESKKKINNLYLSLNNDKKKQTFISIDNDNNNNISSTCYSNKSIHFNINSNNSNKSKISPNINIFSPNNSIISPNNSLAKSSIFNDTSKNNIKKLSNENLPLFGGGGLFQKTKIKELKKSKTIKTNAFQFGNKNKIMENILNNRTDDIYLLSKNIRGKNNKSTINKINEYLNYRKSKLPLLYNGNKFKDTLHFFHRIKNEIQNNDFKYKYKNIKKFLNDKEKQKLENLDKLESNLVNKEKELLVKVLRNKM